MDKGVGRLFATPFLPFVLLSAVLLIVHESWRDEAEAWLIARDGAGLGGFFQAMRYEGTPALWHLMLMPMAKLGLPFLSARLLHAAIAVGGVALLSFASPFKAWEKWLMAFGYFVAYEYDAIARSYVLLVFLLFLLAWLDRRRHEAPMTYGAALALLANTSLHGLIIAAVVATAFGIETLQRKSLTPRVWRAAGVVALGFGLAAWQMRPPPDLAPWLSEWHLWPFDGFKAVLEGFLPLPGNQHLFWNSNWLDGVTGAQKGVVVVAILASTSWVLRTNLRALAIYVAAFALLCTLFVVKYYGGAHHAGLLFVVFLYCLWVTRAAPRAVPSPGPAASPRAWRRRMAWAAQAVVVLILVAQVMAAAVAVQRDATGDFSGAAATARYLDDSGILDGGTFVAAYPSFSAMGILAQLKDPHAQFYFAEFNRTGSWTPWSAEWQAHTHMTLDKVLASMDAVDAGNSRVVLIVNTGSLVGSEAATGRLALLATFGQDPVGSLEERFSVYRVAPPASAPG